MSNFSDIEFPFNSDPLFDQQAHDIDSNLNNSFNSIDSMNALAAHTMNATGPIKDEEPSLRNLPFTANTFSVINGSLNPHSLPEQARFSFTLTRFPPPMGTSGTQPTCDATMIASSDDAGQSPKMLKPFRNTKAESTAGKKPVTQH
ncbi:hypothetical protein [Endozoicomonas sp. 8E]|uniref:hypothetical protein n=1 Tax=Endozoicomonas sp. 8E TaxID=3035692 RepID=UPI00293933C3|nr:hypothetical protein [Endozoicomonas sp. 8E]WOG27090.1 hypothetical protein P6910_21445 [Endozoicomonas sp. 8E]